MASSSHLKHGEKGVIVAKMSTVGKKGLIVETIEVISNDPKRPKEVLKLQATILEIVQPQGPESIR
jgi:hypothetical protein